MEILYLLIPVSVILVFAIGVVFWWSLKSGQYDDLEGPGYRVLMDDDAPGKNTSRSAGDQPPSSAEASSRARESL